MARRRAEAQRRRRALDPLAAAALSSSYSSVATIEHRFGSIDAARKAWKIHGTAMMATARPGERPAGFWLFTAGVPAELRDLPRRGDVRWGEGNEARDAVERARAAWLASSGRLDDHERASLEAQYG